MTAPTTPPNEPASLLAAPWYTRPEPVYVAVAGNPVAVPVGTTNTPPPLVAPALLGANVSTWVPTVAAGPPTEIVWLLITTATGAAFEAEPELEPDSCAEVVETAGTGTLLDGNEPDDAGDPEDGIGDWPGIEDTEEPGPEAEDTGRPEDGVTAEPRPEVAEGMDLVEGPEPLPEEEKEEGLGAGAFSLEAIGVTTAVLPDTVVVKGAGTGATTPPEDSALGAMGMTILVLPDTVAVETADAGATTTLEDCALDSALDCALDSALDCALDSALDCALETLLEAAELTGGAVEEDRDTAGAEFEDRAAAELDGGASVVEELGANALEDEDGAAALLLDADLRVVISGSAVGATDEVELGGAGVEVVGAALSEDPKPAGSVVTTGAAPAIDVVGAGAA